MTLAEVLLWKRLKNRQVMDRDFDRQRPIGNYIVDFFCKDLMLAIEVDGHSHDYKQTQDQRRQKQIEGYGICVLRFWDIEVKTAMTSVIQRIEDWIKQNGNPPRPSGTPPREGN